MLERALSPCEGGWSFLTLVSCANGRRLLCKPKTVDTARTNCVKSPPAERKFAENFHLQVSCKKPEAIIKECRPAALD